MATNNDGFAGACMVAESFPTLKYSYPLDNREYKGRLLFTTIRPIPVTLESLGDAIQPLLNTIKTTVGDAVTEESLLERLAANNFDIGKTLQEAGVAQDEIDFTELQNQARDENDGNIQLEQVSLYLPQSILIPDQASYNSADLGAMGAGAEVALQSGNANNLMSAAAAGISGGVSSIIDAVKGGGGGASTGGMIGMAMASGMLGQGLGGAVRGATRITPNPNSRMLFQNVGIREFTFDFEFKPISQREATEVREIVQWFRFNLYPEIINLDIGDAGQLPLAYRFPNLFRIAALYKSNPIEGLDFKDSYLRNVQTTWNASSMTMLRDGSFPEVKLTLSFTETKPLSKADFGDMLGRENQKYEYGAALQNQPPVLPVTQPETEVEPQPQEVSLGSLVGLSGEGQLTSGTGGRTGQGQGSNSLRFGNRS